MLIIAGWKRRNWNRVPNRVALMALLLLSASVISSEPWNKGGAGMLDSARSSHQTNAPDSTAGQGQTRTPVSGSKRAEPRLILFRHG